MDNQKTLTISIPTWNRTVLLQELLDQLVTQIENCNLVDKIEIIVSDNFSSDNTENIVLSYCKKYNFVKYFKNDRNLGAKTNVIKSLYLANSKYVLLLGDDDRIRNDCLHEILIFLEDHPNISLLIDTSKSKYRLNNSSSISLNDLLSRFFWYMGNAGLFICSTNYIKTNVDKHGYNFFNECWPQTQLMILGNLVKNSEIYIKLMNIPIESKHNDVMIYSSFYLWRTCILELHNASSDLKMLIPNSTYLSCQMFMKSNIKKVFFNILQCGIFVDLPPERKKTQQHIIQHINKFSLNEQIYLSFIILIFKLPTIISKPFSNLFIFLTKGFFGLKKKNNFVKAELEKRLKTTKINSSVRKLDFER